MAWQKHKTLFRLRNALPIHVVRGQRPDEAERLRAVLLGEGSTAPEDAAAGIEALEPGWMPQEARVELGL